MSLIFWYFYFTLFSFFLQREASWYFLPQKRTVHQEETTKIFTWPLWCNILMDDLNSRSHKWVCFIWSTPWIDFCLFGGCWVVLYACIFFFNIIHLSAYRWAGSLRFTTVLYFVHLWSLSINLYYLSDPNRYMNLEPLASIVKWV